jgi:5'-deoxynucleotidase YfbR-like HD superfamily hydrolase
MRKTLYTGVLLFLMSCVLSSCGASASAKITDEFTAILNEPASEQNIEKAEDFLKANFATLNDEQMGEMLLLWEEYALNYDNNSVDYARLVDEYENEIPNYLTEMFEYKALEQKRPIISDATLQIDRNELISRTLEVEEFIKAHRDNLMIRDDALWLYKRYVNAVLMGASNSPVFDFETREFSRELLDLYDKVISDRSDSTLAAVLTEYEAYLAELGYVLEYDQKEESAKFFETCSRLVSEAELRVYGAE